MHQRAPHVNIGAVPYCLSVKLTISETQFKDRALEPKGVASSRCSIDDDIVKEEPLRGCPEIIGPSLNVNSDARKTFEIDVIERRIP